MARQIVLTFGGEESSFDFKKIDRAKLYGKRQRLVLDDDGKACVRAELSDDGTTIIVSGMTQQAYFDEDGEWVEYGELVGIDEEGNQAEEVPSTLGVAQGLQEARAQELSQNQTLAVYHLQPAEVSQTLQAALESGKLFKFPFNYRAGYSMETAFLLQNGEGIFALVTSDVTPEWCELKQVAVDTFADDGDIDDELDFEMF